MEHVIDYMDRRTSDKVKLQKVFPPEDIIVKINASLFEWVIENLCKNAVDAMEGAGVITLFTNDEGDRVAIEVSDIAVIFHSSERVKVRKKSDF